MIAILLATYNGQRYIDAQILSILNQTYKDWQLYIHDDGSNDGTMEVITKYCSIYPNKIHNLPDKQTNRGAAQSFFWLLKQVEEEYYMFCDQDDIWLPNKIEISINELQKEEKIKPFIPGLVFTDLSVTDENMNIISNSMWEYTYLNKIMTPKLIESMPFVTGCTMLFNHEAKLAGLKYESINTIKELYIHDLIIALAIYSTGYIKPINKQLILYRQHGRNVIGVKEFNGKISYLLKGIQKKIRISIEYYKILRHFKNINFMYYCYSTIKRIIKIRVK